MRHVLDASAVIAALRGEPGADQVSARLDSSIISAVNYAEVVAALIRHGNTSDHALAIIRLLGCTVIAADEALAIDAGLMRAATDRLGLSLADRFCLALAKRLGSPALTADRSWAEIAGELDVEVILIR